MRVQSNVGNSLDPGSIPGTTYPFAHVYFFILTLAHSAKWRLSCIIFQDFDVGNIFAVRCGLGIYTKHINTRLLLQRHLTIKAINTRSFKAAILEYYISIINSSFLSRRLGFFEETFSSISSALSTSNGASLHRLPFLFILYMQVAGFLV